MIQLIKDKNKTFSSYLFEKYSDMLINLGYHIIKNSFFNLSIEKQDLFNIAFESCSDLYKLKDETIIKNGIQKILKMRMVQKVIQLIRQQKTMSNYVLNNYVYIEPFMYENSIWTDPIDLNKIEFQSILNKNKSKIKNLNKTLKMIFNDYFILNLSRKEISLKRNINIGVVNQKVAYLKKILKEKFY